MDSQLVPEYPAMGLPEPSTPFQSLQIPLQTKAIPDRYTVPLIINDRVDVALTSNARWVRLGPTDMSIHEARRLPPKGPIIAVSCNNEEQVRAATRDGADDVEIGAVQSTQTKVLVNPLMGVRGIGRCLEVLDGTTVKAVAIGEDAPV